MIYNSESMHVKWAEQSWQNQSHYAKTSKIINQYNQRVNVSNEYSNEAQKHRYIKILNQHNQHVNVPNEYNNQACIKDNDIKSSQRVINSQANQSTKRDRYPMIDQSNATFASS